MRLDKDFMASSLVMMVIMVVTIFSVGMLFLKIGGGVPINMTQTTIEKKNTFDVSAEGESVVVPDEAKLSFGVEEMFNSVEEAQERVSEKMNNFQKDLQEIGVKKKDIKTTSYNVYPNYDYSKGKSSVNGYRVNSRIEVKFSDFSKVNEVIVKAGQLKLNQIGGLTFGLSEEAEDKALSFAREKAIESAKLKAEELAKFAGVKLGKIVNVSERKHGSNRPMPMLMTGNAVTKNESNSVKPQIEPGNEKVVVTVTLSYLTE